jgi:nucleoside-diphosphate-sugar epimerase
MTMTTYLVTGGAGFIGSHLVRTLVEAGKQVRVLDNFTGGKLQNLVDVVDDIDLFNGDIRDMSAVMRAMRGVDVVFHEAAEPSVPRSIADPAATMDINVTGTLNVLTAARDAGASRLVMASTCAIYGDNPVSPKPEALTPSPLSPYAISKLTGEQLCAAFSNLYGFEAVALRYFNVFGARQDPDSAYAAVVPKFLDSLLAGVSPTIYGDGEQSRDFVNVADVVRANLLASTVPGIGGQVFNVASGHSTTVNHVLHTLQRVTGIDLPATYLPARAGDIRNSLADVSRTAEVLGFRAAVSFEDGVEEIVAETAPQIADYVAA